MPPVAPDATAPPSGGRVEWIDAARGLAILTIVVYHLLLWDFLAEPGIVWPPALGVWSRVNAVLGSVRVPLLLVASGLVASRTVLSGLANRANLRRAMTSYYLYVVWLLIYGAFFLLVPPVPLPHRIDTVSEFASQLAVPDTTLWYVFALAVFTLATAATRRWPTVLVLILAVVVSVLSDLYLPVDLQATKVPQNWVFFVIGAHAAPRLRDLPRFANLVTLGVSIAGTVAIVAAGGLLPDVPLLHSAHSIVRSLALVWTAAIGVALMIRWAPLGRALVALGKRTLPVYLLHPLAVYGLMILSVHAPTLVSLRGNPIYAAIAPIVFGAVITGVSIKLKDLAERARLGWLFALPDVFGNRRRLGVGDV